MPEDLAEIYRSTFPALVRFLYRKVWDVERAEDLAQEAVARAVVHKPASARGWLFVVAAHMARAAARGGTPRRAGRAALGRASTAGEGNNQAAREDGPAARHPEREAAQAGGGPLRAEPREGPRGPGRVEEQRALIARASELLALAA